MNILGQKDAHLLEVRERIQRRHPMALRAAGPKHIKEECSECLMSLLNSADQQVNDTHAMIHRRTGWSVRGIQLVNRRIEDSMLACSSVHVDQHFASDDL